MKIFKKISIIIRTILMCFLLIYVSNKFFNFELESIFNYSYGILIGTIIVLINDVQLLILYIVVTRFNVITTDADKKTF